MKYVLGSNSYGMPFCEGKETSIVRLFVYFIVNRYTQVVKSVRNITGLHQKNNMIPHNHHVSA